MNKAAAKSPAPENSAATVNFIGGRGVQIAFPPQRQARYGAERGAGGNYSVVEAAQRKLSGVAARIPGKYRTAIKPTAADFAYACGLPLNENA